jgi:glyoxylase-like metal-dependent hydrolase (beta-lactamase superfamily II)
MRRASLLAALLAAGSLSMVVSAQRATRGPNEDSKALALQKIKDNLYLLSGNGGNTVVFVTDLGVVVVDTKLPGSGPVSLAKIKTVTDKPVITIINTHAHSDHVGSNEAFGTAVEIIAQDNTRLTMDKMDGFRGEKVNYLPKLMFKDRMTLGTGKDRIDLYYFGPGHTNGDAWVVFPAARVVHAGDMFADTAPPIIDLANGGSGLAYASTLARAAAEIKNVDTIVTGHSSVRPWRDLTTYADFVRGFRDTVVDGFDHGLSVSEIVEGWTLPAKYAGYTAPPDRVKADVEAIVGELSK